VGADADVDSIAEKVLELGSGPYTLPAIRSTIHHLVRRGLLSENERCFTITARGERQLAHARDDAKRWIDALGERPGPAGPGN
jgi:predicted transcriptional regulator